MMTPIAPARDLARFANLERKRPEVFPLFSVPNGCSFHQAIPAKAVTSDPRTLLGLNGPFPRGLLDSRARPFARSGWFLPIVVFKGLTLQIKSKDLT